MALSGMTGFARIEGAEGAWSWSVEARSVNGRNLETRFRGPPGFESLERAARDGAASRFQRGQLNVALQAKRAETAGALRVNLAAIESLLDQLEPLSTSGRAVAPSLDGLLLVRGVVEGGEGEDDAEARAALEAAMASSIAAALDALKAARLAEGAALAPVLTGQMDRIAELVRQAEVLAADQPATLKARFERRMAELLGEGGDYAERVVLEAAALAAKADVREELDRLAAHVTSARQLLASDAPAGRRLDFLSQEFMREANTLCSKSALTDLTAVGLELKAVIEQFREQIQNVE
ncbi:MAG: YicC/YloC family endoribonuclease [Pseudomonadota bacterium]|jgi:uncharacterized protein (TIGR00255 family)